MTRRFLALYQNDNSFYEAGTLDDLWNEMQAEAADPNDYVFLDLAEAAEFTVELKLQQKQVMKRKS